MSRWSDQFFAFAQKCGCASCRTVTGSCIRCGQRDAVGDEDVCAECLAIIEAEVDEAATQIGGDS